MQIRTTGTVISVKKQWWLKVNTKPFRTGPLDGARFPHVIKVKYYVDGNEYIRSKWIGVQYPVPIEGETVNLVYDDNKPGRIKIVY